MNITDNSQIIACITTLDIYNFIQEDEEPEAALQKAVNSNSSDIKLFTAYVNSDRPDKDFFIRMLKQAQKTKYQIVSYGEFKKLQKQFYLSKPLRRITKAKFFEMLNILPPLHWVIVNGCEEFLISEFWTATFTDQYATKKGKYYAKTVDAADKSTWIHNLI